MAIPKPIQDLLYVLTGQKRSAIIDTINNNYNSYTELHSNTTGYVRKITAMVANGTYSVPAGYQIESIVIKNTTANAITGGLRIGTTDGGAEVVTAQAVGANAFLTIQNAAVLLKVFSTSAAQTLYLQAVTGWNSASIDVYVKLSKLVAY